MNEIMEELILEDKTLRWSFKKPYIKMIEQDFSSKISEWSGNTPLTRTFYQL
jgi:hypothetical protein